MKTRPDSIDRRRLLRAAGLTALVMGPAAIPRGVFAAAPLPTVQVWKDPNCGCCKDWVVHLQRAGFRVQVTESGNAAQRARLGLPEKYGSCHTALVDGYVVEGHVPAADVQRLLRERPDALGLAAPGMPVGSPGMDGPEYGGRRDRFDVLLVRRDGRSSVFATHNA